jgi:hypothetical protein
MRFLIWLALGGTALGVFPMSRDHMIQTEALLPVHSRVSWGAITAGSVIALALYFLLTLLGGAIGFSLKDYSNAETIGKMGAIWAIAVTACCLYMGGFVASQLTTGENRGEGAVYGLLVWAVVFAMLVWLMATGVRAGFNAMLGVATAGTNLVDTAARNTSSEDWEAAARRYGFDQAQIDVVKERVRNAPAEARNAVEDPATRDKVSTMTREVGEKATQVSWYTFLGTVISMLAAAFGGFIGSGPSVRVFVAPVRPTVATRVA